MCSVFTLTPCPGAPWLRHLDNDVVFEVLARVRLLPALWAPRGPACDHRIPRFPLGHSACWTLVPKANGGRVKSRIVTLQRLPAVSTVACFVVVTFALIPNGSRGRSRLAEAAGPSPCPRHPIEM